MLSKFVTELTKFWFQLQPTQQALVIAGGVILLGALLIRTFIRLGRRSLRRLFLAIVILLGVAALSLSTLTFTLPEAGRGPFQLKDEAIRLGATLSLSLFVLSLSSLAIPFGLKIFERGGFAAFVAARHVRSEKSGFLTAISFLSVAGVGISSLALCCVVSIMGGFGADLKRKILDNNAHIRVQAEDAGTFDDWREPLEQLRSTFDVIAATPVVSGEVMASSSTNTAGMQIRGVEVASLSRVIDVPQRMLVGGFQYLDDPIALRFLPEDTPIGVSSGGQIYLQGPHPEDAEYLTDGQLRTDVELPDDIFPGVILGKELARSLHVYVGDVLTLVSPMGDLGPMGILPRTRKFRVGGIFNTGMYEYDATHAYLGLEEAQELLDFGHLVTALDLKVEDVNQADLVRPRIADALARDDLRVRDWKEMNRNLFSALKLEKFMIFVVLSIAILVASFCIICTLLLMVTEKSKEIAILKAMGASDRSVLQLFLGEGMFIGGAGTLIGVATGWTLMTSLKFFGFRLDPEVYYIERLPVNVETPDYLLIALCAFLITTLATVYPALAASRLRPIDGIRHE